MRTTTARLAQGLTLRQVLTASSLEGARVLAGSGGLDRVVERMNVMEVPDILPWVKPREFLLTTAYPLREAPARLGELVGDLDARGLSGLGIKVGRYIDEIPADMLARADELAFPLVRLPDGIGFDDILNEVLTDILDQQAVALERSERVHRTLVQIVLSGGGLAEIARDLAGLLDACVVVTDPDGRVLASSRLERVEAVLRADGALAGGRVRLTTDDVPGRPPVPGRLQVPISAGGRLHGHILAVDGGRGLDADDLPALENAATVAALAITKTAAVAAVESRYRSELLHDLLDGRIDSAEEAGARASSLGWDIDRPVIVLVVRPGLDATGDREAALDRLTSALDEAARARDAGAATVASSREVLLITGAPEGADEPRAARALAESLRRSARAATGLPLRAGISRVARGPLEVPLAHEQAATAERIGGGDVTHFDDLGAFRLLSLVGDRAELDAYVADVLGPLGGDDPASADLRATLETVLSHNLNIAESARRLHFHYNTLRYRVDKLERMLGPFTRDPDLRLGVELALQVLRLRRGLPARRATGITAGQR